MMTFPPLITYGIYSDYGKVGVIFAVTDLFYRITFPRGGAVYIEWNDGIETSGWLDHIRRSQGEFVSTICERMGPIVDTGLLMVTDTCLLARVAAGRSDDFLERMKKVLLDIIGPIEFVASENPEGLKPYVLLTFRQYSMNEKGRVSEGIAATMVTSS